MTEQNHRGYDPDAYDDTSSGESGESLTRECPFCGESDIQLPHHLPCDDAAEPAGERK